MVKESSESFKRIFFKISDEIIKKNESYQKKQKKILGNYFIYKLKKWVVISKKIGTKHLKESFLLSYDNEQIVCKICAKSVLAKTIKEHSSICLKLTEARLEIKKIIDHINNEITPNLIKSRRTFHIQNMIVK